MHMVENLIIQGRRQAFFAVAAKEKQVSRPLPRQVTIAINITINYKLQIIMLVLKHCPF